MAVNVLQNKLNGELDSVLLDEIEDFDSWTKLDVSKLLLFLVYVIFLLVKLMEKLKALLRMKKFFLYVLKVKIAIWRKIA